MAKGAAQKKTKPDPKDESTPKEIGGVNLEKVDRKILVKYAKQLKCGDDKDTTEALVAALSARFAKLPLNRLADCNDCGGSSDKELEVCPYCGASDDDEASASESESESEEASSEPSNDTAATAATVADESVSIDDDPKLVKKQRATIGENTKLGIAGANENTMAQYTEKDLNEAVDRVRRMKGDSMVSHWRLGHEITGIFEKQLWKQRNKEDNKPAYSSFNQFILSELGFTVQNAYWLMDVSAQFTEEQVRIYGTTKLGYVLTAPKEDRARLLEAAKAGASAREIRQAAHEAREEAGTAHIERETGRQKKPKQKGARAKPAPKKKPKAGTITVAKILGKCTVDLFKGPWPRSGKPETHAKKLGDNPVGMRALENGVVEYFSFSTTSSGRLILRVDTRRED